MSCGLVTGRAVRYVRSWRKVQAILSYRGIVETDFFQGRSGKGKQVKWGSKSTTSETGCCRYLSHPSERICEKQTLLLLFDEDRRRYCQISFRCKASKYGLSGPHEKRVSVMEDMDSFLEKMGERLSVNNLYVSSVIPVGGTTSGYTEKQYRQSEEEN